MLRVVSVLFDLLFEIIRLVLGTAVALFVNRL